MILLKKYQSPSLKKTLLWVKDIIEASSNGTNIVSSADSEGADEIDVTAWNNSWN